MTSLTPLVSILTPTYNHESFIAQCIESVLAQTFTDWELIVLDDGSTDHTLEIASRYTDPRIRVLEHTHVGLEGIAETYNRGLAAARGSLVAILEGDDYWPRDKLSLQLPAFDDASVVLAFGIARVIGSARKMRHTLPKWSLLRPLPRSVRTNCPLGSALLGYLDPRHLMFTYPCTVVIRRAALDRIGGFHGTPHLPVVDYPTFLCLALEGAFSFTEQTVGFWRVHSAGTTLNRWDSILSGASRAAEDFRTIHEERLGHLAPALRHLDGIWRGILGIREGRRLLAQRRWPEAHREFHRAVKEGVTLHRAIAVCGAIAAMLRLSIEPLYRVAGRPYYRRCESGELEVVF